MPSFLSRLKSRDGSRKKKNGMQNLTDALAKKPKWDDAFTRQSVEPEEIHELLHICTAELKARGMQNILVHDRVQHNNHYTKLTRWLFSLQALNFRFYCSHFGQHPIQAQCAPSLDASSMNIIP